MLKRDKPTYSSLILVCCLLMLAMPLQASNHCVVLLHGLARTHASMMSLQEALITETDFVVVNQSYPSRQYSIQELAEYLPDMLKRCPEASQFHFVTHSLGGIILRYYLQQHPTNQLGHIIMLSPPNQGSEIVDKLRWLIPLRWLLGPAFLQLGTDSQSIPRQLEAPQFVPDIYMGDHSIDPLGSWLIPGPDDGRVSIDAAKLNSAHHLHIFPVNHAFIMQDQKVITAVIQRLLSVTQAD